MKIVVFADESHPREFAHARVQTTRLRRAGFDAPGPARLSPRQVPDSAVLAYAVGAGGWRSAFRAARRVGVALVYDHPPGTEPPARLGEADAVVAAGPLEAARLGAERGCVPPVVVPPCRPRPGERPRPRLRGRLGIDGRAIALQETGGLASERARALVRAVASIEDIGLVLLGGEQWDGRPELEDLAGELGARSRIHFVGDVPAARRFEYLGEADVGLEFASPRPGSLAAADIFELLGVPYLIADADPAVPCGHPVADDDPVTIEVAIAEARERGRAAEHGDGQRVLTGLLSTLGGGSENGGRPAVSAQGGSMREASAGEADAAARLRERAEALVAQGETRRAIEAYAEIIEGPHSAGAVVAAAAGLARLGELAQARTAVDRVLGGADPPVLAVPAAVRVLEQVGEPRTALRVARQLGEADGIGRIEGTLKVYDPTWLPARKRRSPAAAAAGRAFYLLETSLPHVRSGYTYRARTLLLAQQRIGIEPTVLTRLGFPETRGLRASPVERVDGVDHHRVTLDGVASYTSVPVSEQLEKNVRWASALGRELRPEGIVAATPHLNGLVGLSLRNELASPMVYDVRGFPEMTWAVRRGGSETEIFALRRIAETRCMREADLVTTLSETMRQHIIARGVAAHRVHVLPHAVDTEVFSPRPRDESLAARLGLTGRPVVAYVSSLVAYEGVETLLEAIAIARCENPRIAGLIVGDGDLQRSLEARAAEIGLAGHVVFTGRVDAEKVSRYYSLADIFVCPREDHEVTRYVTPLKPFEAMATGCCVAVSDLPTLREAVRSGECGALFPAGDAEGLAATVLDLLEHPDRMSELRAAAREHAVTNHGLDALCSRLERVWGELRLLL